jgi:hypothetical protein
VPSRRLTLGAILVFLYIPAITIRAGELRRPLGDGQQWLTSTVLRTQQIWAAQGITTWRFLPVMSYPLVADKHIDNQASLADRRGNWFYTSYGPLAYIAPYLVTRAAGISPSAAFLGWFNMAIHFATALMLFLLVVEITRPRRLRDCVPAIVAFALYTWSPETLWFHSNPYMSDMFVQPLFAFGALLFVRALRAHGAASPGIFFVTFAAVLTEWLGVMFAAALVFWFVLHRRDAAARNAALAASAGALLAVGMIVWHYSAIAGIDAFIEAARGKYSIRSGTSAQSAFTLADADGWRVLASTYWRGYWPVIAAIGIMALATRRPSSREGLGGWTAPLFVTTVAVLLHHAVFFDFTAEHPFSALKTAVPLSLAGALLTQRAFVERGEAARGPLAAILASIALAAIPSAQIATLARHGVVPGRLLIAQLAVILGIAVAAFAATWRRGTGEPVIPIRYALMIVLLTSVAGSIAGYKALAVAARNGRYERLGTAIARNARSDEVVFISDARSSRYPALPMTVLYARRNLAPWRGPDTALALMSRNGARSAVHFQFDSSGSMRVTRLMPFGR